MLSLVNSSFAATKTVSGTKFTDIQKTINSASSGDIVSLSNVTYKGTGSWVTVNKSNIVIQGPSSSKYATLDGENARRIFYVTGNNVTIKYVTITRGKYTASVGAGIRWTGNTGKLQNSIIKNCQGGGAYFLGSSPYISYCSFESNTGDNGAGLIIGETGTNAKVLNSKFTNNKGTLDTNGDNYSEGGALDAHASTEISSCTFTGNTAKNGGALALIRGSYKITSCTFSSNIGTGSGGAIYSNGASITLASSTFTSNKANSGSGGVFYISSSPISITSSSFNSNVAGLGSGGVIYASSSSATIASSSFSSNSATTYGGAIYSNAVLTINTSTFTTNKATSNGGAIYGASNTKLSNGNIFTSNTGANGGAVFIAGSGSSITANTFKTNKASVNGGGIYSSVAITITSSSIFDSNSAQYGAGAFFGSSSSSVGDSTFKNNVASVSGAGLYSAGSVTIYGSIFSANKATSNGGGLYSIGTTIIKDNSIFNSNSAVNGGAAFITGVGSSVTDSEFNNNIASVSAGGIYSSNSITISSSSFLSNKASNNGGGIYSTGTTNLKSDTIFESNTAINGGAVFITSTGTGTISESKFSNNIAIGSGGGIYSSNNLNISDSSFESNKANCGGGAYSTANTVVIVDSTFFDCFAIEGGGIYKYGGYLEINGSVFYYNFAITGAAIFKTKNNLVLNDIEFYGNTANTTLTIGLLGGISYGGITEVLVNYSGGNNVLNAIWNNDNDTIIFNGENTSSEGSLNGQFIEILVNGDLYTGFTDEKGFLILRIVLYPSSSGTNYLFNAQHPSSYTECDFLVNSKLVANTSSKKTYNVVKKVSCPTLNRIYTKIIYLKNSKGVFKKVVKNGKILWTKQFAKIISRKVNMKTCYYIIINKKQYLLNKTQSNSITSNQFSRIVPNSQSLIISYSLSTRRWNYNYNSANLNLKIGLDSKNISGKRNVFYYIFHKKNYLLKANKKYFKGNTYFYTATIPVYAKYAKNIKYYANNVVKYTTHTTITNTTSNTPLNNSIMIKSNTFTNTVLISSKIEPILS
ncbi:MAG: beta strand repeat-containing protein [Methanobacteriaceae archaeon]